MPHATLRGSLGFHWCLGLGNYAILSKPIYNRKKATFFFTQTGNSEIELDVII
jgi:hypothetical protein